MGRIQHMMRATLARLDLAYNAETVDRADSCLALSSGIRKKGIGKKHSLQLQLQSTSCIETHRF